MLTLKQLKKDIQFNAELSGLIDVLKGIASAQFRQLQAKREYFIRFNNCLESLFNMVNLLKSGHVFLKEGPGLASSIVMLTSDTGFLGGLNTEIVNAGLSQRQEGDSLIVLGEIGAHFLEEQKESFLYFRGIAEEINYAQAQNLEDYLAQGYLKGKFGKVVIVYPKFISFTAQEVKVEQLLPYSFSRPAGRTLEDELKGIHSEVITEPTEDRIIDYLIRAWLAQKIYDIFWEAKLSELASRVMHLEGSSQAITDLSKRLQFSYFRTLHKISDKNIREIYASRLIEK